MNLKGEAHSGAKLTEQQVLEIRATYKPHVYSLAMLARKYHTIPQNIHNIVTRKTWRHI